MTAPTPPSITVTAADSPTIRTVTIQLPGAPGPQGIQGIPGPANVLTIGTVTTSAPGSAGAATISGVAPSQTLNLTIPQGPKGDKGDNNVITIGTVTTTDALTGASATLTGTSPSQVLNLVIPRGYGVIPGGTTGQLLAKASATDYDTAWTTPHSDAAVSTVMLRDASGRAQVVGPSVGNDIANKTYTDNGDSATLSSANSHADTGDTNTLNSAKSYADTQDAATLASASASANSYTDVAVGKNGSNYQGGATYTFVLADATRETDAGSASASTFTVPPNSSVAFPVGTRLKVVQFGSGQLTIAPGAGVSLHRASGFALTARQQFSEIHITKRDTNDWVVSGDLTADTSYIPDLATQTFTNATFVPFAQKGAASGVAALDSSSGLVMPSYEDIVEIATPANPATGHQRRWMDSTSHRMKSVDSAGTVRTVTNFLGSGTAFPSSPQAGDTYFRTDQGTYGSLWHYTGNASAGSNGWVHKGPILCTSTTRPTVTYAGLEIHQSDNMIPAVYNGATAAFQNLTVGFPVAFMRATAQQTGIAAGWGAMNMGAADIDSHSGWTSGTPTRWTVPTNQGGVYAVEGVASVANPAAGQNFNVGIRKNGTQPTTTWGNSINVNSGSFDGLGTGRKIYNLVPGDYLELWAFYGASTWGTYYDTTFGPHFSVERIR